MSKVASYPIIVLAITFVGLIMSLETRALVPFTRPFWELDDPFRILEQTPLSIPKANIDPTALALARADWKETQSNHMITLDIPGMRKEDLKIEVEEENRVLRVSGERKIETQENEGDKWHRVERTSGKFWRQFRMPLNADLEHVKAELHDGVLNISVPKIAEDMRKKNKVVHILSAHDKPSVEEAQVKATTTTTTRSDL